jgi:hypothetical protein
MKNGVCLKCDSLDIIQDWPMVEHGHYNGELGLTIKVAAKPQAFIFKGAVESDLRGWICGQCGYIEWYAAQPADLLAAYRKRQH